MSNSPEIKLGIIGIGNMGRFHAKCVLDGKVPGLRLAAVADQSAEAAQHFPDVPFFSSAQEMISSGQVEAVLIATPHYDHTTIGIVALEAGLHVLVEKPISVHKADAERLIAAHRNPAQIFAAMFNQRTDPRYLKLKKLITEGELGTIHRINWIITDWFRTESYYSSGGWRATWAGEGGGVLLNQCPHQIDLWQWLFGLPLKVRAFCQIGRFHDIEVEDNVTAYFEYADGKTGVFITTTGEAPGTNRLEIAGERGRVIIEGNKIQWLRNEVPSSQHSKEFPGGFTKPEVWHIEIPFPDNGEQHLGILKNFAAAIRGEAPLLAPAQEGLASVELANAMIYSSFTDSTVSLPLSALDYESFLKKKVASSTFQRKAAPPKKATADFTKSF